MKKAPAPKPVVQDGANGTMGIYKPKGSSLVAPSGGDLASVILSTQPSNLLGYYKCDDASGSLVDSSSKGNDLAVQGSGATYGVDGLNGDAVNGNATQGWNNNGVPDTGVDFMPGDNGFTIIQFVRSAGGPLVARNAGWGSSTGNSQCYDMQFNASGNRSMLSIGNQVTSFGNMNVLRTNILDDTTSWHMVGVISELGGGTTGDDAIRTIKNGIITVGKTNLTFFASPQTDQLDVNCVNSIVISSDASVYGGWDQQHVCLWNTELTAAEVLAISDAAGTT